jgi:hypothetical protein
MRRNGSFLPPKKIVPLRYRKDAPLSLSAYTPLSEIRAEEWKVTRQSNLDSPVDFAIHKFPPGSWYIDKSFGGIYGHSIEQLVWIKPSSVTPIELDSAGNVDRTKQKYVDVYYKWLQSGLQPPPIHVLQTDDGSFIVTNGHRRYVVARALKKPLLALVSYSAKTGKKDTRGIPITTSLTYEVALQDAALKGKLSAAKTRELESYEQKLTELRRRGELC